MPREGSLRGFGLDYGPVRCKALVCVTPSCPLHVLPVSSLTRPSPLCSGQEDNSPSPGEVKDPTSSQDRSAALPAHTRGIPQVSFLGFFSPFLKI